MLAESGGKLRFGHALFREVLVRELDEEQRRVLHGRVAEALGNLGAAAGTGAAASDAELAHHALRGPRELLPRAVEHALRAATRAQDLCAYDDAIRLLERAGEVVAAAGNPPAPRARLLIALGQARIRRGDTAAGQAAAREAAVAARELDDAELAAQAALTYGRVFTFGAVDPVLVGMLEESLEALPPGDSALRARLLARLGAALQPNPKIEEPVRVAREAIATARRLGDRPTLLETLHDAISALMDMVDPAEQRRLNLEAEGLALELGDRERLLRTHGRLALAHLNVGELEAADARIDAFEALAHELKAPWVGWRAKMLRAVRASMHGRFEEARRLGDEGLRLGEAARRSGRRAGLADQPRGDAAHRAFPRRDARVRAPRAARARHVQLPRLVAGARGGVDPRAPRGSRQHPPLSRACPRRPAATDRQSLRDLLRRRARRAGRPARARRRSLRADPRAARRVRHARHDLPELGGPDVAAARSAGGVAGTLG